MRSMVADISLGVLFTAFAIILAPFVLVLLLVYLVMRILDRTCC